MDLTASVATPPGATAVAARTSRERGTIMTTTAITLEDLLAVGIPAATSVTLGNGHPALQFVCRQGLRHTISWNGEDYVDSVAQASRSLFPNHPRPMIWVEVGRDFYPTRYALNQALRMIAGTLVGSATNPYQYLLDVDAAMRLAERNATQGTPPFHANPGPADATPQEIEENARSYQRDRSAWIARQWDAYTEIEQELTRLLAAASIDRRHWDAYAEGYAEAPTAEAYAAAVAEADPVKGQ